MGEEESRHTKETYQDIPRKPRKYQGYGMRFSQNFQTTSKSTDTRKKFKEEEEEDRAQFFVYGFYDSDWVFKIFEVANCFLLMTFMVEETEEVKK